MVIIGIDPSLTSLGYCVLNTDTMNYNSGSYKNKNKSMIRLKQIKDFVRELVTEMQADIVFIEGYSYGSANLVVSLAELGGILRLELYSMGIKFQNVPPMHLKKYVCGKGNAKKELMLVNCLSKFGQQFDCNDRCDAYCLARFGEEITRLGVDKFLNKYSLKSEKNTYRL